METINTAKDLVIDQVYNDQPDPKKSCPLIFKGIDEDGDLRFIHATDKKRYFTVGGYVLFGDNSFPFYTID